MYRTDVRMRPGQGSYREPLFMFLAVKPLMPSAIPGFPKCCLVEVTSQPKQGWCGPAALRYCFLWHGYDVDVNQLGAASHVSRRGTNGRELELAALCFGSHVCQHNVEHPSDAFKSIDLNLYMFDRPVIVCVDGDHWVSVVAKTKRGYIVMDPDKKGPIITVLSSRTLQRKMAAPEKGKTDHTFSFLTVTPPTTEVPIKSLYRRATMVTRVAKKKP